MNSRKIITAALVMTFALSVLTSGCAVNFYKQSPRSKKKIKSLKAKITDLEKQREQERREFAETKRLLERKLSSQIKDEQVSLKMDDRGLVIILSDDILFDSGKAEIKSDAKPMLDKVAKIIRQKVPEKNIGVTGHTDNVPITHSKWESNWELSTARATNVLHYLVKEGVSPGRLSATGYGEHKPIATNATAEGRAKNRRVEIVILPEFVEKNEKELERDIK
ncbi:MAG: OmpA family protein [Candidatus Omnitrophica bacterium]|nr:OmpA family protein [Candidatus Omnitrophota bacterium]